MNNFSQHGLKSADENIARGRYLNSYKSILGLPE